MDGDIAIEMIVLHAIEIYISTAAPEGTYTNWNVWNVVRILVSNTEDRVDEACTNA